MFSTISRICANAIWASPEERTVLKAVEIGVGRISEGNAMRCTKCGNESSTGRKFCATCGSPLSSRCPKCGAENAPSSAFCEDCGASGVMRHRPQPVHLELHQRLPRFASRPGRRMLQQALDGERKTVTAL